MTGVTACYTPHTALNNSVIRAGVQRERAG
jgi:hypothetical protein